MLNDKILKNQLYNAIFNQLVYRGEEERQIVHGGKQEKQFFKTYTSSQFVSR